LVSCGRHSVIPFNLPVGAAFVTWAGTFAAGGPRPGTFRKLVPTMFVGVVTAWLIVTGWALGAHVFSGTAFFAFQCVVLFCLNAGQMLLARFGFASFFGVFSAASPRIAPWPPCSRPC
jgi:hypothetical protein